MAISTHTRRAIHQRSASSNRERSATAAGTRPRGEDRARAPHDNTHTPHNNTRLNDLDGDSWRAFLSTFLVEYDSSPGHYPQGSLPRRFNGRPILTEADSRALYRWFKEGASPTLWCADRFLTAFGLHLDFFFIWCAREGCAAWWLGHPPAWHEEEIDVEAIAEWREEAVDA
jgi:hypothetical protein